MNGLGRGLAQLPADSEDEPSPMHAEGSCQCMACLWSMSYYYPTTGGAMDKPGVYPGSLTGAAVPGTLGYQQQTGIQPSGPARMPAGYTGSSLAGAQAFPSMGPTPGYPGTAGSPYATLSASPFGAPAGLYQASGLGYAAATLASPTLANPQSMYATPRVPATSTPTQVYPGTAAAAHYAGGGMYGYSMPMTATPNPYSPSMAAYHAGQMPGHLSSYASVPGAAPLGPGATYPGTSPYTRQMP